MKTKQDTPRHTSATSSNERDANEKVHARTRNLVVIPLNIQDSHQQPTSLIALNTHPAHKVNETTKLFGPDNFRFLIMRDLL